MYVLLQKGRANSLSLLCDNYRYQYNVTSYMYMMPESHQTNAELSRSMEIYNSYCKKN